VDRQRIEPIADFADHLRTPQAAKIPVAAQQVCIRGKRYRADFQLRSRFHAAVKSEFHSIPDRAQLRTASPKKAAHRQNCAKRCTRRMPRLWKTAGSSMVRT